MGTNNAILSTVRVEVKQQKVNAEVFSNTLWR